MNLSEKIDYVFEQVNKSKVGPIAYEVVDDKVKVIDYFPIPYNKQFFVNNAALEVFRTCLLSYIEMSVKMKDEFPGDEWKRGEE